MSEGRSHENQEPIVEHLKQQLAAEKLEKEKLVTRLKGYETVAKLANEKHTAYKDLQIKVNVLQRQLEVQKARNGEEQKQPPLEPKVNNEAEGTRHDSVLNEGLNDLQSSSLSAASPRGTSSSFTVLGKNSTEARMNFDKTAKHSSLGHGSNGDTQEEGFQVLYHPELRGKSDVGEKESVSGSLGIESTVAHPAKFQSAMINLEDEQKSSSSKSNTSFENVQVFPENMQSGGSNFLDSQTNGGQSCMNSSRKGPMSIIGIANGSLASFQYVETRKGEEKKNSDHNDIERSSSLTDAVPVNSQTGLTQSDLFSGTGARPKDLPTQQNKPVGEEESLYTELQAPTSNSESTFMVKIPSENTHMYRVNNAPLLSYGKQESCTEISALTSFGSSLSPLSPLAHNIATEGNGKYNNLNMTGPNLQERKTEDFVMVETLPPANPSMDTIIPVIQSISDESKLRETNASLTEELQAVRVEFRAAQHGLETSRKKMTQLQIANKEWKASWDGFQKRSEHEIGQLQGQLSKVTQEKDKMQREMECRIASQKEELNRMSLLKKDTEKAYAVLQTGRAQEKQLLEKLKQDYGTLHQEKRALEVQLEGLLRTRPTMTEEPRVNDSSKTISELETELAVVNRQVNVFVEDFHKEHQERMVIEKRLQKEKETVLTLENKLKNSHALLKARDEDLRQKSKQVADLQFQVDDLKLKLEAEKRRSAIYPSMDALADRPSFNDERNNVEVSFESEPLPGHGRSDPVVAHINLNVHTPKPQKWSCIACTFDNKIGHKKCYMCGTPYMSTEAGDIELG